MKIKNIIYLFIILLDFSTSLSKKLTKNTVLKLARSLSDGLYIKTFTLTANY